MSLRHSVLLFGNLSYFTTQLLSHLGQLEIQPSSAVVATFPPHAENHPTTIFHSPQPRLVEYCIASGITLHYCAQHNVTLCEFLDENPADIYLIACYPRKLPSEITNRARFGCINVHPSLLPKYRGPDPLFWQLLYAEQTTGVSLHFATDVIDGGDILASQSVPFPDGARLSSIEHLLAESAAQLFTKLCTTPVEYWQIRSQPNRNATSQPMPCEDDLLLHTKMEATTVYNLIRAYANTNRNFRFVVGTQKYSIKDAHWPVCDSSANALTAESSLMEVDFEGGRLHLVLCADGSH